MTTPSRSLRRRTTAASAALLLGLTLAACGGDDSSSSSDGASDRASGTTTPDETASTADEPTSDTTEAAAGVPTEDEVRAVLLTAADVPEGLTEQPDDADDEDDDGFEGTCLAEIGEFSDAIGFEPDTEAQVEFASETASGLSSVTSQVEAYAEPDKVAPAFASFTDELQTCTSVATTDPSGVTYDLQIAYDDTVAVTGADDQLAISLDGTIDSGGQSYDVAYRFDVALLGPFISIVGAYVLGDADAAVLDTTGDLAELQAGRVTDQLG